MLLRKIYFSIACSFLLLLSFSVDAQNVGINTDGSAPGMLLDLKVPASSAADGLRINNANPSDGDAVINLQDNGSSIWTFGLDDSNANSFKVSNGGALGTNDRMSITTAGFVLMHSDARITDTCYANINVASGAHFEDKSAGAGTSSDTALKVFSSNAELTAYFKKSFLLSGPVVKVNGSSDTAAHFRCPAGIGIYSEGWISGMVGEAMNGAGVSGVGNLGLYGNGTVAGVLGIAHNTSGRAGEFRLTNALNSEIALWCKTEGTGWALLAENSTSGKAGRFVGDVIIEPAGSGANFNLTNIGLTNEPSILPTSNNYGLLGSSTLRFYEVHATNITYYGTLTNASDARIKENIVPLNGGLAIVEQLNPVTYDLKMEVFATDTCAEVKRQLMEEERKNKIGFIAQEVEAVVPQLVKNDTEADLKSVNYIGMIPILVEAVQELSEQNKQQAAEIDALRQKLKQAGLD